MKVAVISNITYVNPSVKPKTEAKNNANISQASSLSALNCLAVYNKSLVNFKGYYGDSQPSKKLFWILSGRNNINYNDYVMNNLYKAGDTGFKKWSNLPPQELLKFHSVDAIEAICTLNSGSNSPHLPGYIETPNYGTNWGRHANYIEFNPRTIARTQGDSKSEGLLNMIKLLPAIPPSANSFANCIILSQLYPSIHNDGKIGDSSLYTVNLHTGISKNLTSKELSRDSQRMGDDEMVKAFNDLAHYKGLKTGIRMPLSAGQIKNQGRDFDWHRDEKAYIDACCWAVDLGFDCIYFDSAKHVGFYDMDNYYGCGNLPDFEQMQYITAQIRAKTGRNDISLIGEKCNDDYRFKEMGLSAGTDWSRPDGFESVMHESKKQAYNNEYAAGPDISNDNDYGQLSYEQRLGRIHNAFNGYEHISNRLPSFMQMTDLFPISGYTNTHKQMMEGENLSTYSDVESNYNNLFNDSTRWYTNAVNNEFLNVMYL